MRNDKREAAPQSVSTVDTDWCLSMVGKAADTGAWSRLGVPDPDLCRRGYPASVCACGNPSCFSSARPFTGWDATRPAGVIVAQQVP